MSTFSPRLEQVIREIGDPVSPVYRNLRALIEESPALLQQMNDAVARGHLKHFAWMNENENAGASFSSDTQTVNLKQSDVLDPRKRHALTFIIGHEVQHGANLERTRRGLERFDQDARRVLESGEPVHDYSQSLARMLSINRSDEASAHIAGWNALVSRLKHGNPEAKLSDMGELSGKVEYVNDFVELKGEAGHKQFIAKAGFTLNADLSITPDARNIEAAATHYFDKVPADTRLGYHGNSDYTNYYAAGLVGSVCQYEMLNPALAGTLHLDMQHLKLHETLLEQNGLSLGKPDAQCPYVDTHAPAIDAHFDHTADAHRYVPIQGLPRPIQLHLALKQDGLAVQLSDPTHPDHALFRQAQSGVHRLDAQVGRTPDHRSDQLAAALVVAARSHGMNRIEHVTLSTDASKVFAVQGALNSPFKQFTSVPTVESLNTPIAQSSDAWEQNSAQTRHEAQEQSLQQPAQRQEFATRL